MSDDHVHQQTWGGSQGDSNPTGMIGMMLVWVGLAARGWWQVFGLLPKMLTLYFTNGGRPFAAWYPPLVISVVLPPELIKQAFWAWQKTSDWMTVFWMFIAYGMAGLVAFSITGWIAKKLVAAGFTWAPGGGELRRRIGVNFQAGEFFSRHFGPVGRWVGRVLAPSAAQMQAGAGGSTAAGKNGAAGEGDTLLRGGALVDKSTLTAQILNQEAAKGVSVENLISLGGVPLPYGSEPQMGVFSGATGAGKSQAFQQIIFKAQKRGNPAIVADSCGGFFSKFGRDGDLIFNLFDARSVRWNPFLEIRASYDYAKIAAAALPDQKGETGGWSAKGRALFADVFESLHKRDGDKAKVKDLLWFIQSASATELGELIGNDKPSSALCQPGQDTFLGSVRGTASLPLAAWRFIEDNGDFSVRKFVRDQADQVNAKWLFVTYEDDQMALVAGIVGGLFDLAMTEILGLPDSADRRFWLLLDEMDSLGKVSTAELFSSKARKKGGCLYGGIQTTSQLVQKYGKEGAQTLMGNLLTKLVLLQADKDTATYFEGHFGKQLVSRFTTSQGTNQSNGLVGFNLNFGRNQGQNEVITEAPIVMHSELMQLKPLCGYLQIPTLPITKVELEYIAMPVKNEPFINKKG